MDGVFSPEQNDAKISHFGQAVLILEHVIPVLDPLINHIKFAYISLIWHCEQSLTFYVSTQWCNTLKMYNFCCCIYGYFSNKVLNLFLQHGFDDISFLSVLYILKT